MSIFKNKTIWISGCLILLLLLWIRIDMPDENEIINIETSIKYDTFTDLDESADAVVIGHALKPFKKRNHFVSFFEEHFHTLTDIEISTVFRSKFDDIKENQVLEIVEPVSAKGNDILTYDNYKPLNENEEYIIFLARDTYGQYRVINIENGNFAYNISKEKKSKMDPNSLEGKVYDKYVIK